MNDESPLVRQWILLRTLASRKYGATVKELAGEAGVSIKTIRRDLETFQTAGFPLREVVGDFGRKTWRLESARPPAELHFTWDEAAALYLGRRLLEPLMGTVFWQAARDAFRKIHAYLEPVPRAYLDKFAAMFGQTMIGTHDYSKKADLIDSLLEAIEEGRAVSMTYRSLHATEPVTYTVWAYGLAYHRGSLYVVGRPRRHEEICHWKVDRIEAVDLKDEQFSRPEDFDLQQHLSFQVIRRFPWRRGSPRQSPIPAGGRPVRRGVDVAPEPEAGSAAGWGRDCRVYSGWNRGAQAVDHELRQTCDDFGTGRPAESSAGGDEGGRGSAGTVFRPKRPKWAAQADSEHGRRNNQEE